MSEIAAATLEIKVDTHPKAAMAPLVRKPYPNSGGGIDTPSLEFFKGIQHTVLSYYHTVAP